jgi:hypothetical protein
MIRLPGLITAAILAFGVASGSAVAQERGAPPPTGDYWQTCRNVSTVGYGPNAIVTAQCQDRYGRWNNTSLRVGNCTYITNVDGRLECRSGGNSGGGWNGGTNGGRPPYSQPQATLFSGLNFSGQAFDTNREYSNLPAYFNDKALSLRITGRTAWEVCSDANFRGNCQILDRDVPDLRRYGLGFAVSSLRPADSQGGSYPGYPGYPPPPPPPPPPWGGGNGGGYRPSTLVMFPIVNFGGGAFEARSEYSNLPRQFNDTAHSLRIVGGGAWEVCADANFRGRCQVFDRDVPDLNRFGMAEAISSVRQIR